MADRAVSTVVTYVLVVGIIALLIAGLITGYGPLVAEQQTAATYSALSVLSQDVVSDIELADRRARQANESGVVRTRLPARVGGQDYFISLEETATPDQYTLILETVGEQRTTVSIETGTPLTTDPDRPLDGGSLVMTYEPDQVVISRE